MSNCVNPIFQNHHIVYFLEKNGFRWDIKLLTFLDHATKKIESNDCKKRNASFYKHYGKEWEQRVYASASYIRSTGYFDIWLSVKNGEEENRLTFECTKDGGIRVDLELIRSLILNSY